MSLFETLIPVPRGLFTSENCPNPTVIPYTLAQTVNNARNHDFHTREREMSRMLRTGHYPGSGPRDVPLLITDVSHRGGNPGGKTLIKTHPGMSETGHNPPRRISSSLSSGV